VEQTNVQTAHRNSNSLGYLFRRDTIQCRFLFVDLQAVFGLVIFNVPIDIDHTFRLLEYTSDVSGDLDLAFVRRSINLGNDCLLDRRAWWNLGDFDVCTVFKGDLLKDGPYAFRNIVTLR
jgi:hypothetical protein